MRKFILFLLPLLFTSCFSLPYSGYDFAAEDLDGGSEKVMSNSIGECELIYRKGYREGADFEIYIVECIDHSFSDRDSTICIYTVNEKYAIDIYEDLYSYIRPYVNLYRKTSDYISNLHSRYPDVIEKTLSTSIKSEDGKFHIITIYVIK